VQCHQQNVVLGCGLPQLQLGQQLLLEQLLPAAAFADDTAEDQIPERQEFTHPQHNGHALSSRH
jgi:hypothetical protein